MRILVTNDDGYLAVGIKVLAEAARALGTVQVIAPDREQSATSHSLTLHHPLRARRTADGVDVVDGTPTDCVALGLGALCGEPPDFVISGVNHGANLGDDVLYSGTVAAAMEATILGIRAIAISYTGPEPTQIETWSDTLVSLLRQLLERDDFPNDTLLNVNLPSVPPSELKGIQVTTLSRRAYVGSLTRALDPNGREYFWIGGGETKWWGGAEVDFRAVHSGYISVTPLHLDLTNYNLLEKLRSWKLKL
jgi:5'-nucleotidase